MEYLVHKYNISITLFTVFNITFFGPKTWNDINESLKSLSKLSFKRKLLKQQVISGYDD
jgi:hypothetical protein